MLKGIVSDGDFHCGVYFAYGGDRQLNLRPSMANGAQPLSKHWRLRLWFLAVSSCAKILFLERRLGGSRLFLLWKLPSLLQS